MRLAFSISTVFVSVLQLFKLICAHTIAPSAPVPKYSRVILETSSTPNFSSLQTRENGSWESKGFVVRNISVLLQEHYTISPPPSISKASTVDSSDLNSTGSQVFCSNKSATLTIVIKDFRHPVMFLNFSYYIDKSDPNENEPVPSSSPSPSELEPLEVQVLAGDEVENATVIEDPISVPEKEVKISVGKLVEETLQHESHSTTNESELDDAVPEEAPSSLPEPSRKRRKRALNTNSQSQQANISRRSSPSSNPGPSLKLKTTVTVTPSLSVNSTTPLSPLTLVQAVEVIKSAAAVVAAAGITTTSTKTTNNGNGNSKAGNTPISKTSKTNVTNESTKSPTQDESAIQQSNTGGGEGNNNSKTVKVKNEKRNGKHKNNRKHENKDEETEKAEDSSGSSSSSSSEEDDGETRKKKISYKTWRASLEKRNRPPGLYVTVNDDIVFDNWDGIWNKDHVLGKWSGAKASPKDGGSWNQTYLFMSWDDVSTSHDVKITFEWEPIEKYSHVILSDIVVSTIAMTSDCKVDNHDLEEKNKVEIPTNSSSTPPDAPIMLGDQPISDKKNLEENNITSYVILQRKADGKATWNILKMERTEENKYENLSIGATSHENEAHAKEIDFFKKVIQDLEKDSQKKGENSEVKGTVPDLNPNNGTLPNTTKASNISTTNFLNENQAAAPAPIIDHNDVPEGQIIEKNKGGLLIEKVSESEVIPSVSLKPSVTNLSSQVSTTGTTTDQTSNSSTVTTTKIENGSDSASKPQNDKVLHQMPLNKHERPSKKTDGQTALLMSVFTGCIALAILVLTIKKRIDIAIKGRNATR